MFGHKDWKVHFTNPGAEMVKCYLCRLASYILWWQNNYSRTAIARTPMARLPWLIRTRFESLRNSSDRKQIFSEFSFYMLCVLIRMLMSTHNIQLLYRKWKKKSLNYRFLLPDLVAPWLTLICSNFSCLEQFSMVPKLFEPLKYLQSPNHCFTSFYLSL